MTGLKTLAASSGGAHNEEGGWLTTDEILEAMEAGRLTHSEFIAAWRRVNVGEPADHLDLDIESLNLPTTPLDQLRDRVSRLVRETEKQRAYASVYQEMLGVLREYPTAIQELEYHQIVKYLDDIRNQKNYVISKLRTALRCGKKLDEIAGSWDTMFEDQDSQPKWS